MFLQYISQTTTYQQVIDEIKNLCKEDSFVLENLTQNLKQVDPSKYRNFGAAMKTYTDNDCY